MTAHTIYLLTLSTPGVITAAWIITDGWRAHRAAQGPAMTGTAHARITARQARRIAAEIAAQSTQYGYSAPQAGDR